VLVRVSRPRSMRQFSGLFFCPSRASPQRFSQVPGASRSQHRLSSFLLTNYGCMVHAAAMLLAVRRRMNTGLRKPGVASPLQKRYLARSNKDSIVFRFRLTCIRVWWFFFTLILNRIPLLQVQSHTHSTDRMLSPTEELPLSKRSKYAS